MPFCNGFIRSMGGIVCSVISWLIRLVTSIGRAPPQEELPIVSSTGQPTMAPLEAFHTAEHNVRAYSGPRCRTSTEQLTPEVSAEDDTFFEEAIRRKTSHNLRSKYHGLSFSMPFVCNPPTAAKPCSPLTFPRRPWIGDSNTENVENRRCPISQGIDARIGDLAKRRGFKGAPLTLSSTSSMRSSFLSFPRSLGPWSVSSPAFLDKTLSPRTPLAVVTQRMRSASTRLARIIVKDISQDLPLINDRADPFAMSGDTYFAPEVSFSIIPPTSLYSFEPYCRHLRTHRQTRSLGPGCSLQSPRSMAPSRKIPSMKTTIYDMSTADVASARVSVLRNLTIPGCHTTATPASPTIVLTVPSAPSSPIGTNSASSSASDLYQEIDLRPEAGSSSEADDSPTREGSYVEPDPQPQFSTASKLYNAAVTQNGPSSVQKRSALVDIRNAVPSTTPATVNIGLQSESGANNLPSPLDVPVVNLDDFGLNNGPGAFAVPEHPRRSSLRPLVLASRTVNAGFEGKVVSKRVATPVDIPNMNTHSNGLCDGPGSFTAPDHPNGSSLRPLILPARVANRAAKLAERLSTPGRMIRPMKQETDSPQDRSRELDDIIALLDLFVTQDCATSRA